MKVLISAGIVGAAGYAPDAPAVTVKECVSRYAAIGQPPAVSSATEEEHG